MNKNIKLTENLNEDEKKTLEYIYNVQKKQGSSATFTLEEFINSSDDKTADKANMKDVLMHQIQKLKITAIESNEDSEELHIPLLAFYVTNVNQPTYQIKINNDAINYIEQIIS